ncbi:hypothetical protein ABIF94_006066 [Bradyrhizobium ottawaense]
MPLTMMKSLAPPRFVAIEGQEAGLTMAVPGDIADGILHEQVEVVGVAIRPVQRDHELGLGIDLALLGIRGDREQRKKEQERDHLERLEQHHAQRIERLLARIETEIIHHDGIPTPLIPDPLRSSTGVT